MRRVAVLFVLAASMLFASTAQASVHLWLQTYWSNQAGQYTCQYGGWYNNGSYSTYIVRYQYPYGGCPPYMLYG